MTTQLLVTLSLCLLAVAYVNGQDAKCLDCKVEDKCVEPQNAVALSDRPELNATLNISCENGKVTLTFRGRPDSRLTKFETVGRNGKKCSAEGPAGNLDKTLSGDYHDCLTGGFEKNDEDTCFRAWTDVRITQRVTQGDTGLDLMSDHKVHTSCCIKMNVTGPKPIQGDPLDVNATACEHFYFNVNPRDMECGVLGWEVRPSEDQFTNFYPTSSPHTNWYVDNCYAKGSGPDTAALVTDAILSKNFIMYGPTGNAVQQLLGGRTLTSDPGTDFYEFDMPEFAINGNANINNRLSIHCTMKICSTVDPNADVFLNEYFGNIPADGILCAKKFSQTSGELLSEQRRQIQNVAAL